MALSRTNSMSGVRSLSGGKADMTPISAKVRVWTHSRHGRQHFSVCKILFSPPGHGLLSSPMAGDSSIQRILRLTPCAALLDLIAEGVRMVPPHSVDVAAALSAVLAEDVIVSALPACAIALRDGFAVEAAQTADAGPYTPVILPETCRIEIGDPLPEGTDAVLPMDAVNLKDKLVEAIASVPVGQGVLSAGGDAKPNTALRRTGEPVRTIDLATFRAAGITNVAVRAPRISVAHPRGANDAIANEQFEILRLAVRQAGGIVAGVSTSLESAFSDDQTDAVIGVGGTGSGERDASVKMLTKLGRVEMHGIAITPGETTAYGFAGDRPVLLLPGRLDAMLSAWLLIGRHLMAALNGGNVVAAVTSTPLKRKITSTIGLTELIPIRCVDGLAEPLATGYLSLTALARSDGWTEVPAGSEGFGEGTFVAVNPWP
jgi:molybdopterin molybdotransferase